MPDGDIVHSKLSRYYQKVYKQICDGQFGGEALAHELLHTVIKDIQKYGDEPITLIKNVAVQFEQLPTGPLLKPTINWDNQIRAIEDIARKIDGNRRGIALAIKASKDFVYEFKQELKYGDYSRHIFSEITRKYLQNIYRADFEDLVPAISQHYKGVSQEFVRDRLVEMQPYVMQGLEKYVSQIVKSQSINYLSLPRNTQSKTPIPSNTNLLNTDLSQLTG